MEKFQIGRFQHTQQTQVKDTESNYIPNDSPSLTAAEIFFGGGLTCEGRTISICSKVNAFVCIRTLWHVLWPPKKEKIQIESKGESGKKKELDSSDAIESRETPRVAQHPHSYTSVFLNKAKRSLRHKTKLNKSNKIKVQTNTLKHLAKLDHRSAVQFRKKN